MKHPRREARASRSSLSDPLLSRSVWLPGSALLVVLVLAVPALASCGRPGMAVPKDLSREMDTFTTKGRKASDATRSFEFGPYQVEEIELDWSGDDGFERLEEFKPDKGGRYRYELSSGGKQPLTGKCAPPAPKQEQGLDGSVTAKEQAAIACTCLGGKKKDSEAYLFVEDLAGEYTGPVVVRDVELKATAIYGLDNGEKLKTPTGYRLEAVDGTVAGVEALPGKARVWIRNDLGKDDRRALACVLVGLMMYEPPDRSGE